MCYIKISGAYKYSSVIARKFSLLVSGLLNLLKQKENNIPEYISDIDMKRLLSRFRNTKYTIPR